jgi:riboflavin transporter FmnP|tara:strand:+ start:405 stop:1007 length:603 start_codon:yes stop_codon:yes gene_type:complete
MITLNRKSLTASILFSSIALVLHPPFLPLGIPAPYAPFLIYQIWEIPLFICLLLFGPTAAVISGIINFISLLIFFPGQLISGPIYNLIAIYSSYLGIILVKRTIIKNHKFDYKISFKNIIMVTASSMILRTLIMTIVNYIALPRPPPIGFSIPMEAMPTTLGLIAIFNATTIIYSIPIAFSITKTITKSTDIKAWILTKI